MFMPSDMDMMPRKCRECNTAAAWEIYNKKIKMFQEYCKTHVPPVGTPRMLKHKKIQIRRCWPDDVE